MAEGNSKPLVDEELDIPRKDARERLSEIGRPHAGSIQSIDAIAFHDRLAALENAYRQQNAEMGQMRAYVLGLGKQEDITRMSMERNVRAAAADLAIKSATEETKTDSATLAALAGVWLDWLKGGEQT